MSVFIVPIAIVVVAVAQVTVAPRFPLGLAQADLLLVSLALVTVFAGRRAAMISVPLMAFFLAALTGRSMGLLIIAFLPFPLLAYWLSEGGTPISRYLQTLAGVAAAGIWARALLALATIPGGADFDTSVLILQYVIPGLFLDAVLLSVCYLPCRLFGLEARDLSPAREYYRA